MSEARMQYKSTNGEVIKAWVNREESIYGEVSWQASSIYAYDSTQLHSSFFWNPLAVRIEDEQGQLIVINAEDPGPSGWGNGGGRVHQQDVRYAVPSHEKVLIPFDILDAAGISPLRLERDNIVDFSDGGFTVAYDNKSGQYYHTVKANDRNGYNRVIRPTDRLVDTRQGDFKAYDKFSGNHLADDLDPGRYTLGFWHRMGGVVIRWHGAYFVIGTDEGAYFMSQLPRSVGSVEEALESLRPAEVSQAIENGLEVKRQGEWFFIPTDLTEEDVMERLGYSFVTHLRKSTVQRDLPKQQDSSDNVHVARLAALPDGSLPDPIIATGKVYHRHDIPWLRGTSTGEHRSLDLNGFYIAMPNTAVQSWSIGGNAD